MRGGAARREAYQSIAASRQRGCAWAAFVVLSALHLGGAGALHDEAPICPPAAMELACSPSAQIVTQDGTPVSEEFRACAPRYCTEMPYVKHGTVTPMKATIVEGQARVAAGEAVRISCDRGYELSGALGVSAQPKCVDGCTFEEHDVCVPKKCMQPFQDPNGVVVGGPLEELASRNHLEFDEYVRITCNHGYMASDSAHGSNDVCKVSYMRECLADGSLTHIGKSCVPLTCAASGSDDASLMYNSSGTLVKVATYQPEGVHGYKDRVNLTCNEGYYLAGGSPERECSWTCQYTSTTAHCLPSSCNVSATPPNSHWRGDEPDIWTETGTLQCDYGHVFDLDSCASSEELTCGRVQDGVTVLDKQMRSCVPAICKTLTVENSDKASPSASDARNHSDTVAITCNEGYRAVEVNSSDPVPPLVSCSAPDSFDATCGMGKIPNATYAPCEFDVPLQCRKTMCEVRRLDNGVNSPAAQVFAIGGRHYIETGVQLTQTCNDGYAMPRTISGPEVDPVYSFDVEALWYDATFFGRPLIKQHTTTCQTGCQLKHASAICRPILCGDVTVPTGATAMFRRHGVGDGDPSSAGDVIRNVSYSDTVTLTCALGTVRSGHGDTCNRDYVMTCGTDGVLSAPPPDPFCETAVCPISLVSSANAVVVPESGTVEHGVKVNVTCGELFRVRDEDGTLVLYLCVSPCLVCAWRGEA